MSPRPGSGSSWTSGQGKQPPTVAGPPFQERRRAFSPFAVLDTHPPRRGRQDQGTPRTPPFSWPRAPVIALLIALVFGSQAAKNATADNWASVAGASSTTIFLLALAALWFGCSNSAREIVGEWAIYHRERMVNLKIPSYVGSKLAVLGGLCLVQCAILLVIVHWGTGLRGPWLGMFLMLLLTSLVGLAIGLTVSALARTSEVAIALLPLILLPMVILAGVLQPCCTR